MKATAVFHAEPLTFDISEMSNFATGNKNEGIEQASQPTLCSNNCGFFANVGCTGLCSKCHREHVSEQEKKKAAEAAVGAAIALPSTKPLLQTKVEQPSNPVYPSVEVVESRSAPPASVPEAASVSPEPSAPRNPGRCSQCRKKVGLTGFKCKCGEVFCGQHRYAEAHQCGFDYKSVDRQKLAENNPVVQASKIQKI